MTRPNLDALTFDERLRVASGRPVRSIEDRIIGAALERYRTPDPDADAIVRASRAANRDADRRRRPVPVHLLAEPEPPPPPADPGPDTGARSLADAIVRARAERRRGGRRFRKPTRDPL